MGSSSRMVISIYEHDVASIAQGIMKVQGKKRGNKSKHRIKDKLYVVLKTL
jgi:hypothetical protein